MNIHMIQTVANTDDTLPAIGVQLGSDNGHGLRYLTHIDGIGLVYIDGDPAQFGNKFRRLVIGIAHEIGYQIQ